MQEKTSPSSYSAHEMNSFTNEIVSSWACPENITSKGNYFARRQDKANITRRCLIWDRWHLEAAGKWSTFACEIRAVRNSPFSSRGIGPLASQQYPDQIQNSANDMNMT
jgi:hypothetical protein